MKKPFLLHCPGLMPAFWLPSANGWYEWCVGSFCIWKKSPKAKSVFSGVQTTKMPVTFPRDSKVDIFLCEAVPFLKLSQIHKTMIALVISR